MAVAVKLLNLKTHQINRLRTSIVSRRWADRTAMVKAEMNWTTIRGLSNITTRCPISAQCSMNSPIRSRIESIRVSAPVITIRWETCRGICFLAMSHSGVRARLSPTCTARWKIVATLSFKMVAVTSKNLTIKRTHMNDFLSRVREIESLTKR